MKKYIITALTIIYSISFSQDYKYKTELSKIDKSDFYKIQLLPEITSKLNNDFGDIRIYDNNKIEIPYIFYQENRTNEKELFTEYEITEIKHFKRYAYTRIIIHNPNKTKINNIALRIKNADVRKHLKLNASYDKENWYVLKDNYYYNSITNIDSTSEIRILNFPLSDYEYYELLIGDYFDKPINITQAGYYNTIKENGKYTKINNIEYTIKDTLKETIIKVINNGNYIDKITFEIDSPRYYYREVEVYVKKNQKYKKRRKNYVENIGFFNLISNSNNTYNTNNLHTDTLYIKIKNNDNYSLHISDISFFQLNKYLVAELNPSKKYNLFFGNQEIKKPKYDLKYFADSIPDDLKIITNNVIEEIKKENDKQNNNFNLNSYWLWIVIISVTLLLIYMSVKMIKENKK